MRMSRFVHAAAAVCITVLCLGTSTAAHAAIPLMINHQGLVKVNGQPFNGNGLFKFGFVDVANLWLWTNDGTHVGELASTNLPSAAITLPVANGIYSVRLGDSAYANMSPIPSSVFDTADVKLRILFTDGTNGWQTLSPDQPVTASGYAYHAATADNALLLQGSTAAQLTTPSGTLVAGLSPMPPAGYSYGGITVGDGWRTGAAMPTARKGMAAASVNGVVYVIGGSNGSVVLNTNEAYDSISNTWTAKAPMPTPRYLFGAAVVNGIIYAIGGDNAVGEVTSNEAYNPATDTWSTRAPIPTARSYFGVAVVNGIVYVIGGGGVGTANEAYDPSANSWSTKAPMPTGRAGLAASVVNGVIYAMGGGSNASTTNEAYYPAFDIWTTRSPIPTARTYALGAVASGGRVFVIGGGTANEAYDPATNSWMVMSSLTSARSMFAYTSINDNAICIMGGNASGAVNDLNELYTPPLYFYQKN